MDDLDGVLLVPPDRNHILTRPQWKSRYVLIGRRITPKKDRQSSIYSQSTRPNNSDPKVLPKLYTDDLYISVFKSKGDSEPIQQWPISHVSDCQVQMLAYRKQGPILPTLVVTISDKERKRRSSRSVGLISNKDSGVASLWFRTPPEDHHPSIYEWAQFILMKKSQATSESSTPMLSSPFSPRSREVPEYFSRPGSGSQTNRTDMRPLQHKSSSATYSTGTRDQPTTFSSDSPSLRSKRSDLSSPSSINQHPHHKMVYAGSQHYTSVPPSEVGSPGVREGNYQGEFIEGWTTAQGRSSTMSSPIRGRESMNSPTQFMGFDASSPPAPGETILDRAFQLGHIPGAESNIPGQEKFSSIARFDTLMRNLEEQRKQREAAERSALIASRSTFEADESSDEDEPEHSENPSEASNVDAADELGDHYDEDDDQDISPAAQRALAIITGRHEDTSREPGSRRPTVSRAHLSFQTPMVAPTSQSPPLRPHTSHAKNRPSAPDRNQSTPQLVSSQARTPAEDSIARRPNGEKRQSGSSSKRLSFTEFTMKLSSTSSSLLVQTTASGSSSRESIEIDQSPRSAGQRGSLTPRGTMPPPRSREWKEQDRRCGWRGSVGYIGTEGGFL